MPYGKGKADDRRTFPEAMSGRFYRVSVSLAD